MYFTPKEQTVQISMRLVREDLYAWLTSDGRAKVNEGVFVLENLGSKTFRGITGDNFDL